jgi:guanylate kinase
MTDKRLGKYKHNNHTHKTLIAKNNCKIKKGGVNNKNNKDNKDKNLILLAGKAASGKSTIAKIFEKKGYNIISTDEIIYNKLIPKYKDKIESGLLFSVQNKTSNDNPIWYEAQKEFFDILQKKVKMHCNKNEKVVVEGQLTIPSAIRYIFGNDNNFTLYVISPPSLDIYIDRLTSRVISEPEQYGRLAWLEMENKDFKAKKDLFDNGKNGKIWKPFITKMASEKYLKHKELYDDYKKDFNPIIYIN